MYSYYSFLLALITITITASTLLYPPQISHGYSAVDGAGVHIHIKPQNGALLYRYVIKYFSLCSVNVQCEVFALTLTFYFYFGFMGTAMGAAGGAAGGVIRKKKPKGRIGMEGRNTKVQPGFISMKDISQINLNLRLNCAIFNQFIDLSTTRTHLFPPVT